MKQLFFAGIFCIFSVMANAEPAPAILGHFKELYPNARKISWARYNDLDEVYFLNENIQIRMLFDSNGHIIQTLRYYFANELPAHISFKLKEKYFDKEITSVTEMWNEVSGTFYFVNIENAETLLEATVDPSGSIINTKKYKKP